MNRLDKLFASKSEVTSRMRAINDLVDKEGRPYTEAEEKEYTGLEARLEVLNKDIEREEKLIAEEKRLAAPRTEPFKPNAKIEPVKPEEFKGIGEFFSAIRFNRSDNRLAPLEKRAQSMAVGETGGFMVPEKFIPELLQVQPQEAIFRPRCTVIPSGDSPDQTVTMPALDQGANQNMYGGVTVAPIAEGGTLSETDLKLKEISLTPNEIGAYIVCTDKLLRNWQAAGSVISTQLRKAIIAYEDTKFYNGNGAGLPMGILNAKCSIAISRTTASQVVFADVRDMYARLKFGGSPIWITSQTCLPYLISLADGLGNLLWNTNLVGKQPGTLMGIPVLLNDRSVALGTKGDLVLADLSYYLIKDGLSVYIATSEHVYFTSNKTVFKAVFSIDGKPWLNEALPLEGSTSNTVSPFIVLS